MIFIDRAGKAMINGWIFYSKSIEEVGNPK